MRANLASRPPIERKFYCYVIWRASNGTPIYVGKGHGVRAHRHEKFADCGVHINKHLSSVITKDKRNGFGSPRVEIVKAEMTESEAFAEEIMMISKYGRIDIGTGTLTNKTDGGDGVSGLKMSPESRAKMRQKALGKVVSKATREKLRIANKGKKLTEEHKAILSSFNTGRRASVETREKQRMAKLGKKRSPEICKMLSEAQKGRKNSPDTRAKISAALTGKKLSAAHIDSLRMAHLGKKLGPMSDEAKQKIGRANSGKIRTPEMRIKLGEASVKRWMDPEYWTKAAAARRAVWADPAYKERMREIHRNRKKTPREAPKIAPA